MTKQREMTLKARSRWGNFNLMNPQEKSLSVAISLGDKTVSVSHTTALWEVNGYVYPEEIIDMLTGWLDRTMYSSSEGEVKDLLREIKENKDKIEQANRSAEIKDLKEKRDKLDEEIELLKENND